MLEIAKLKIEEYGKKFDLDLAYIIKSEFWVYARQAITILTGLIVYVAFTRLVSKETFGNYNFLLALLSVLSIVSLPGLNTAVLRSVARGYEGCYKKAVRLSFYWSLLGTPLLICAGAYVYYTMSEAPGTCLMIAGIFFPFMFATNTWDSLLQGKKRFDLSAKFISAQSILNAIAMVSVIFLDPGNLVAIILTYLLTTSVLNCLFYLISHRYVDNDREDQDWKKYGYFITVTGIVGLIANNIDRILIGVLLGPVDLAVYSVALMIPDKLKDTLKYAWTPFTPKFCQESVDLKLVRGKLKKVIVPVVVAVILISAAYILFVDDVIILLFGEGYADSIFYSQALILMVLLSVPGVFFGTFAVSKKSKNAINWGYNIFPFIKIAMVCILTFFMGLAGTVIGLILSTAVQLFLLSAGTVIDERSGGE